MNCISRNSLFRLALTAAFCLMQSSVWGLTTIHVETAGTLSTLLSATDKELKVTGVINGTDIKHLRQLVTAGTVTSLDWSEVRIVSGGQAYSGSFTTQDDIVGEEMFYECSKLQQMVLPQTVTAIKKNAFARTGLTSIDIPSSVRSVGEDAFAYCSSLATVVIGKKVTQLSKGTFWSSNVKNAYVKPATPPAPQSYLFGSSPKIYVYSESLQDYKDAGWSQYGTLYGTLENYYPQETVDYTALNSVCSTFFDDAACTQLKAEYQGMSDEALTSAMTAAGAPQDIADIALKVKNNTWAPREQQFRIHTYKAYSDANYWNEKLWARCASYMGAPTGIYVKSEGETLLVFVSDDVPSDATLYIAGSGVDQMIRSAKTGQRLQKGINIIDGEADRYYYILYTADQKTQMKRLDEWPGLTIHIEGGKVDGYFDAACNTDADYKSMLNAAANATFVVKGKHAIMNIRTSILKETYPNKIAKAIECLDSLSVWEKDLFGISEAVANGEKAGAPYYISGGDAFYPGYFNNPTYVDNDSPGSVAHATEYGIHISFDATKRFLNPYITDYDESGTAHELGHQLQSPIMLEGTTEGSNDLFSNYGRFFMGHRSSMGNPLSISMQEFVRKVPFYWRGPDKGFIRMFYSLYLYYHQAQKNTSFYPELFKALRADKIAPYGTNTNNSGLKFVRKVCEVAQEDLTDFFTVYGFFEPTTNQYLECYGDHYITNRKLDINSTKRKLAQYPVKNRQVIFIEDRVEHVPTTGFVTTAGKQRIYRNGEEVGMCGDLGQFTSYLPDASQPADYYYLQADSLYAMEGKGGVGFLMLDDDNNIVYASNAKGMCIPKSIGTDFTIYACDADGTLHEVTKAGNGAEYVEVSKAGALQTTLQSDNIIKLRLKGKIHGKDVKYMRQLISDRHLASLDLTEAQVIASSVYAYCNINNTNYYTSANNLGDYTFYKFRKLVAIKLPLTLTKIGSNAFANTGVKLIEIPDKVTSIGGDAFAYCPSLTTVIIGKGVKTMEQGVFYGSPLIANVYAKPLTPPTLNGASDYLFDGNDRIIHVYASAVDAYLAAGWDRFGTIVGDLSDDIIDGIETVLEGARGESQESRGEGQESRGESQESRGEGRETYNLAGQMVNGQSVNSKLPRGIYIRNGKKFIIGK